MAVSDFIVDKSHLLGELVAIDGLSSCINDLCFLYDSAGKSASVRIGISRLDRDTKKRLLGCDLFLRQCPMTVTGDVVSNSIELGVLASKIDFH